MGRARLTYRDLRAVMAEPGAYGDDGTIIMAAWETVVEKTVVNRAEMQGFFVRKVEWPGRRGAPDRVFIRDGHTVWIEFKQKGEDAKPHQRQEHDRMRAAGAVVHVCHTEDEAARVLPGYVIG